MRINREQIINALGEVEDVTVAQIIALGVTAEELAEARAWLANDEPLMNSGKRIPTGRLGQLVDLLARIDEEKLASESESLADVNAPLYPACATLKIMQNVYSLEVPLGVNRHHHSPRMRR
jgi:hypothetical protein